MNLAEKLAKFRQWQEWLATNAAYIPRADLADHVRDAFAMFEDVLNNLPRDVRPSNTTPPGVEAWCRGETAVYSPPFEPWTKHGKPLPGIMPGLTLKHGPALTPPGREFVVAPTPVFLPPGRPVVGPPVVRPGISPYQYPTTGGAGAILDGFGP